MRLLPTSNPVSASVLSRRNGVFRAALTGLIVSVSLTGCGGGSTADLRS